MVYRRPAENTSNDSQEVKSENKFIEQLFQKFKEYTVSFLAIKEKTIAKLREGADKMGEAILNGLKAVDEFNRKLYMDMARKEPLNAFNEVRVGYLSSSWAKEVMLDISKNNPNVILDNLSFVVNFPDWKVEVAKEMLKSPNLSAGGIISKISYLRDLKIENIDALILASAKKAPFVAIMESDSYKDFFDKSDDPVFVNLRKILKHLNIVEPGYQDDEGGDNDDANKIQRVCTYFDEIMNGSLTVEQAANEAKDDVKYLHKLVTIKEDDENFKDMGVESMISSVGWAIFNRSNLDRSALQKTLDTFSHEELFKIIVAVRPNSEEFKIVLDVMLSKLKNEGTNKILELITTHPKAMIFLELLQYNGLVEKYLERLSEEEKTSLFLNFIAKLSEFEDRSLIIKFICNQFLYIKSPNALASISAKLEEQYKASSDTNLKLQVKIIAGIFAKISKIKTPWLEEVVKEYEFVNFAPVRIEGAELFDSNNEHIQVALFYEEGDADGENSFKHFVEQYGGGVKYKDGVMNLTGGVGVDGWKLEDHGVYVLFQKTLNGKTVKIYANKPTRFDKGKAEIDKILKDKRVHTVVHRGHVYSAGSTTEEVKSNTLIGFYGSCSGDGEVDSLRAKSPNIAVIYSNGTGTRYVNDPLWKFLNDKILNDQNIDWVKFSKEAATALSDYRSYFSSYSLPFDNDGLPSSVFDKMYQKLRVI